MAVKTVEDLSERARPLYKRAAEAAQHQNYGYAVELMIQVLEMEPAFLDGRKLLRSIQMKQFHSQNIVSRKMAAPRPRHGTMKPSWQTRMPSRFRVMPRAATINCAWVCILPTIPTLACPLSPPAGPRQKTTAFSSKT